jgi:hypothetical protein
MEARGQLRATAAYTLGLIPDPRARDQLARLLGDPFPDARYNAATGLARQGDARAAPRLLEMLAPRNEEAVRFEEDSPTARQWKRSLVLQNGLRAVRMLTAANPDVPRGDFIQAVQRLRQDGNVDAVVDVEATQTLQALESSGSAPTAPPGATP